MYLHQSVCAGRRPSNTECGKVMHGAIPPRLLSGICFCFSGFWAPILSPTSLYFIPRGYSTAKLGFCLVLEHVATTGSKKLGRGWTIVRHFHVCDHSASVCLLGVRCGIRNDRL